MMCIAINPCKRKVPNTLAFVTKFKTLHIISTVLQNQVYWFTRLIQSCRLQSCTSGPCPCAWWLWNGEVCSHCGKCWVSIRTGECCLLSSLLSVSWCLARGFFVVTLICFLLFCFILASASFFHFSESHPESGGKHFLVKRRLKKYLCQG